MASPSKAGVKSLSLADKKLSLGFIMSPAVPYTSPTSLGHLPSMAEVAQLVNLAVFCSASTLTLCDRLEVSLRNAARKVGRQYGTGDRKLCAPESCLQANTLM